MEIAALFNPGPASLHRAIGPPRAERIMSLAFAAAILVSAAAAIA
jgi:hypothetical protein